MAITADFLGIDEAAAIDKRADANIMTDRHGVGNHGYREAISIGSADDAQQERFAGVTAAGELNVLASAQPGVDLGSIRITDGTETASITAANRLAVDVEASVLPAGAATSAGQLADGHNVTIQTNAPVDVAQYLGVAAAPSNPVDVQLSNGTTSYDAPADTQLPAALVGGRLDVNVGAEGAGLALAANQLAAGHTVDQTGGPWQVDGPGAHDAAVSGNPNLLGATTEDAADAAPGNRVATEGQMGRLSQNGDGALYVIPSSPQQWDFHTDGSTAETDTTVHAAPAAGLSLYVTDIIFSTGAATADNIFFEEGAVTVLGPWYLEAVSGRGLAIHFNTPKKITAATALTVTTSAGIAHSIDVTGFIAPG